VRTAAQFAKYVTVALLSAASDWMVFATLFFTFGSPILAQAISRFAGAVVSFGVNKYWSFQSPQHSRAMIEAWRFLVLFIASYTLALSLFSAFTLWGARPYLAKVVTDTACFFFNFLVMRVWVYRPQGTGMDEESGATSLQSDQHGRSVHWG
jgi:putative flippase GtrA